MYLLGNTFAIFVVNYEKSTFRHTHMLTCFIIFFMKILPYVTTPYFQEVGGVTLPLIVHRRHMTSS